MNPAWVGLNLTQFHHQDFYDLQYFLLFILNNFMISVILKCETFYKNFSVILLLIKLLMNIVVSFKNLYAILK